MKLKMENLKNIFLLIFTILILHVSAQYNKYSHELNSVENLWHIIELDNEVLSKVQTDFSDIRILSVSETDTVEVPYFFKSNNTIVEQKGINFSVLNKSNIEDDYFFTIKLKEKKEINEIFLKFQQENFNWLIELQASQDQKDWFSILKDYRILSIQNSETDYSFTKLIFPKSDYKFFRIKIKSIKKPILKSVSLKNNLIYKKELKENNNSYVIKKDKKKTIIEITLKDRIPISEIGLEFSDEIDFQRPIKMEYLVDSFKTEKSWKYNYSNILNSYVSSLENNIFEFSAVFTNKIRLTINNYDNENLKIKSISTKSPKFRMIARFVHPENKHFLVYGNKEKDYPNYDLINFKENVPKELKLLKIGEQVKLLDGKIEPDSSIVQKWWLWLIIVVIIALLAYSTLGMLKKDTN